MKTDLGRPFRPVPDARVRRLRDRLRASKSDCRDASRRSSCCLATRWPSGPAGWATCRGRTARSSSRRASGLVERSVRRVDFALDRNAGYYPLSVRHSLRHGFNRERMRPGHPNIFLDSSQGRRLPGSETVQGALRGWLFSKRRYVSSALLERMRAECSLVVLANVQSHPAVPFLLAARRLGIPTVGYVASWDHTVGKGLVSPHVTALRRPERRDARRSRSLPRHRPAARDRDRLAADRRLPAAVGRSPSTRRSSRSSTSCPGVPVVLVAGNTPTNAPYEGRFVERLVDWWRTSGVGGRLPAPLPAASARRRLARALRGRARMPGRRGPGALVHRPRDARDAAPARRLRRGERRDDPARQPRERPARGLRAVRRGRLARRAARRAERHRQALLRPRSTRTRSCARRASRRSSPGSTARSRNRPRSRRSARRVASDVVGEVDGRAAERVVDAIVAVESARGLGRRGRSRAASRIGGVSVQSDGARAGLPARRRRRRAQARPERRSCPVYNGGEEIVENLALIRSAAARGLPPEDIELIVVSDGSVDGTTERLLEAQSDVDMHVIHYDRNLGKGYAVKMGALDVGGRLGRDRRRRPRPRPGRDPRLSRDRAARAARLRDRLEAASGLGRLLPALAPRRELVLPAAEPRPVPARRPRHAGGAQGVPPRRSPRRSCPCCS